VDTPVSRKQLIDAPAPDSRRGATAQKGGVRRPASHGQHEHVAHALVRTSSAFKRLITQRMKDEFAITGIQAEILMLLATAPAMLGNDLAAVVGVNASTVSHALDGMEQSGLLTRKRCTEDRRVVRIALTEPAKRMARRTLHITRHILDAITSGISAPDLEVLQRVLPRMAENCQAHTPFPLRRRDTRTTRVP
jgi:DNA-binding MarR family transcriptional regulator